MGQTNLLNTLIFMRFSATDLTGTPVLFLPAVEADEVDVLLLINGTAVAFSRRFFLMLNWAYRPRSSKSSSEKCALHTTLESVGPDQFALVSRTLAVHNFLIFSSRGKK